LRERICHRISGGHAGATAGRNIPRQQSAPKVVTVNDAVDLGPQQEAQPALKARSKDPFLIASVLELFRL